MTITARRPGATLNRDYERRPYWHSTMPPLPDRTGRDLPDSVDAVVVGGGYTGLSAARSLASGGATVDIAVNVTATIQSLRALTIRAYDEKAIKERGIRTALLAKLDAAAAGVPGALTDYIDQLKALRGKQILTVWADRLIANAVWVAAR